MIDTIIRMLKLKRVYIPTVIVCGFIFTLFINNESVRHFGFAPPQFVSYDFPFTDIFITVILFIPRWFVSLFHFEGDTAKTVQFLSESLFVIIYFFSCIALFRLYVHLGKKLSAQNHPFNPFPYMRITLFVVFSFLAIVIMLDIRNYNLSTLFQNQDALYITGDVIYCLWFLTAIGFSIYSYVKFLKHWGGKFGSVLFVLLLAISFFSLLLFYLIKVIVCYIWIIPACIIGYSNIGDSPSSGRSYSYTPRRQSSNDNNSTNEPGMFDFYADARADSNNHYHYIGDGEFLDDDNNVIYTYKDSGGNIRRVDNDEIIQRM